MKNKLNTLKKNELEIMKHIHNICVENDIKYVLCAGSLIGAIRHEGFIPWDDDIDITMPYCDYIKFCEIFKKRNDNYVYMNYDSDKNYHYLFTKIMKRNTCAISNFPEDNNWKENGIYVDVFPTLKVPSSKMRNFFFTISSLFLSQTIIIRKTSYIKNTKKGILGKIIKLFFYIMNKIVPNRYAREILFKLITKYENFPNESGYYIGDFHEIMPNRKFKFSNYPFNERILHKFEDTEFYIPKSYNNDLIKMYGENYMQLPPVEERKTHNFIFVSDKMSYKDYCEKRNEIN